MPCAPTGLRTSGEETAMGVELGSAYGKIEIDASGASKGVDQAQGALAGLQASAAKVGAAVAAMGAALTGAAALSVRASASLQSAFAGVAKTTDGLTTATGKLTEIGAALKEQFIDMGSEIPKSIESLMAIGELGGQLGIARDALDEFTASIAALDVSTNLTAEEGAAALARMANIFEINAAAMGENTERLGSTIVALGNNFATTERDIVAVGERIAGAGRIAGLTEADVLGIGAALSSVGVEAEAGGTAVQKVLLSMNQAVVEAGDQLAMFAQTAGMTADEFAALWETDAAEAFQLFVEGVAAAGDEAINILAGLGLEDQRLIRAFLSLDGAGDLLGEAMGAANQAFADNTALTNEAMQRYATLESQMATTKNDLTAMAGAFGDSLAPAVSGALDTVKEVAGALRDLPCPVQQTAAQMAALGGATLTIAGGAMVAIPKLTALGQAFGGLAAGLGTTSLGILGPAGLIAALVALGLQKARDEMERSLATLKGNTEQWGAAAQAVQGLKEEMGAWTDALPAMVAQMSDMDLMIASDRDQMMQFGRSMNMGAEEARAFADAMAALAEAEAETRIEAANYADFEHQRPQRP